MSTVQGNSECLNCGTEFVTEFDTRTGEYRAVSVCQCVVKINKMESAIKDAVKGIEDYLGGFAQDSDLREIADQLREARR